MRFSARRPCLKHDTSRFANSTVMIIVADNLQIVNPRVSRAVATKDASWIADLIRRCQQSGAQAIDINSGPLSRDPQKTFRFLVQTVQQVSDLPLLLDTTNPVALEAGLAVCRNRPIINGFSLEPAKLEHVLPLAKDYHADIIGYLLFPNGHVPIEEEEMLTVAISVFEAYTKTGLPPERLILDPIVAPVSWESGIRHNQAVLSVIGHLEDLLGTPVRTIAGLSNLTTGPVSLQRKIALETTFLPMLAAAGLDMVLMNVFHEQSVQTAIASGVLMGDTIFSWAEIASS